MGTLDESAKARTIALLQAGDSRKFYEYAEDNLWGKSDRRYGTETGLWLAGLNAGIREILDSYIDSKEYEKAAAVIIKFDRSSSLIRSDLIAPMGVERANRILDGLLDSQKYLVGLDFAWALASHAEFSSLYTEKSIRALADGLTPPDKILREKNLEAFSKLNRIAADKGHSEAILEEKKKIVAVAADADNPGVLLYVFAILHPRAAPQMLAALDEGKIAAITGRLFHSAPEKLEDFADHLEAEPALHGIYERILKNMADAAAQEKDYRTLIGLGLYGDKVPGVWRTAADLLSRPEARDQRRGLSLWMRAHFWATGPQRVIRQALGLIKPQPQAAATAG